MFLRLAITQHTILKLLPYFAGVMVIGFAVVIPIAIRAAKKRREAFRAIAESLNFSFSKKDPGLRKQLEHFQLFSKGTNRKISNVMQGKTRSVSVAIFDYCYYTGGRRTTNATLHWLTVIAFRSLELNLPTFIMRPEHFLHKLGDLLGYQDIDFDSHPGFSKEYMVKGRDEAAVRKLFTRDVLDYFREHDEQEHDKFFIEGGADRLMVYRSLFQLSPEKIRPLLLEDGYAVFNLFKRKR